MWIIYFSKLIKFSSIIYLSTLSDSFSFSSPSGSMMNECWILLLWSLRFLSFYSFLLSSFFLSVAQYRTFLLSTFKVHWLFYSVTSTSAVEPMKQFFVVFIAAIFFSSIISMWFFLIFSGYFAWDFLFLCWDLQLIHVSSVFTIAHWSLYMMAALNYLYF